MECKNSLEVASVIRKVKEDLRNLHTKKLELESHLDFLNNYYTDLTGKEYVEYNLKNILEYHYPETRINNDFIMNEK